MFPRCVLLSGISEPDSLETLLIEFGGKRNDLGDLQCDEVLSAGVFVSSALAINALLINHTYNFDHKIVRTILAVLLPL